MTSIEGGSSPEFYPDYIDLLSTIAIVFDEAFLEMGRDRGRGRADWVQVDTMSSESPMYSVLLSPTGGKPEAGSEMIRLMARPNPKLADLNITDIEQVAAWMFNNDTGELAYDTSAFFVEHRLDDGSKKYHVVTEQGFKPWLPSYQASRSLGELAMPTDFSVEDIVQAKPAREDQNSEKMKKLAAADRKYARELKNKISPDSRDQWFLVPQN